MPRKFNVVIDKVENGNTDFLCTHGASRGEKVIVPDSADIFIAHPISLKPVNALFVKAEANPSGDGDLIVYADMEPVPTEKLAGMRATVCI